MEKGGIARERAGVSQEVHTPRCSLCLSLSGLTGALAHGAGREIQAAVSRGRGVSSHAPRSVVRMRVRWRRQARRCRHECRHVPTVRRGCARRPEEAQVAIAQILRVVKCRRAAAVDAREPEGAWRARGARRSAGELRARACGRVQRCQPVALARAATPLRRSLQPRAAPRRTLHTSHMPGSPRPRAFSTALLLVMLMFLLRRSLLVRCCCSFTA